MGLFSSLGKIGGFVLGGPVGAVVGGAVGGALDGSRQRKDDKKSANVEAANANAQAQASATNASLSDGFTASLSKANMDFGRETELFHARESRNPTVQEFDFQSLVRSAEAAGFNPLTALRITGAPMRTFKTGEVSRYDMPTMPTAPQYVAGQVRPAHVPSTFSYAASGAAAGFERAGGIGSIFPDPLVQQRDRLEVDLMGAELQNMRRGTTFFPRSASTYSGAPLRDDYSSLPGVSNLGRPTAPRSRYSVDMAEYQMKNPQGGYSRVAYPKEWGDRSGILPGGVLMPGDLTETEGEVVGEAANTATALGAGVRGAWNLLASRVPLNIGRIAPGAPIPQSTVWKPTLPATLVP